MVSGMINPEQVLSVGNTLVRVLIIIVGMTLVLKGIGLLAQRLFVPNLELGKRAFYMEEKRARTLNALLSSMLRYAVYFVAGVMILQEFRVDTTSLIAGAGIFGLAIGVGAQSLIKDVITGFFIVLEDQFAVGDYIASGSMTGTVEEIGFRVTKLRDMNGVLHIIPHGEISRISNFTRGHMQATINVPIAYEADLRQALALMEEACQEVREELPEVLEVPRVLGVVDLRPGEVVVRIVARTIPLEQVKVETAVRAKIKYLFDAHHIPAPPLILRS